MEKLKFRYVGNRPNPDLLQIATKEPISAETFRQNELTTFRMLYRNEVAAAVRSSKGLFFRSKYCQLPPQHNAFERLETAAENQGFELMEIARASNARNEFLTRVQMLVPTIAGFNDQPFAQTPAEGMAAKVHVSFYVGLCDEFTWLIPDSELATRTVDAIVKAVKAGTPAAEEEPKEPDPLFNPALVMPKLVESMRLQRMHLYMPEDGIIKTKHFFQTPEGHIFRVEVDGYTAAVPVQQAINY